MTGKQITFNLARHGWFCLLLGGALSGGQVANPKIMAMGQKPAASTTATPKATTPDQTRQSGISNVEPDAPVITINGLCDKPPKDKAAASDCKTVITRARFETVIGAVQPNMTARVRREFALRYAEGLVMAEKAEQMGLDKGVNFEEQMNIARIQVLTQELNKAIQREASQISDEDIERYYNNNMPSFEQVEMDRIYVPKTQESPGPADNTLSDADKEKHSQQAEQVMKEVADKLHARAIAGEGFSKLQSDAFKIAGIKTADNSNMGRIRRTSLPPSQVWVMDLKPGEVSSVIDAPNGYLIYKVKTKETLRLDQAREEIKGILRSHRLEGEMHAIEDSANTTLDEGYFGSNRHRKD